jgi:hypothetical protein
MSLQAFLFFALQAFVLEPFYAIGVLGFQLQAIAAVALTKSGSGLIVGDVNDSTHAASPFRVETRSMAV